MLPLLGSLPGVAPEPDELPPVAPLPPEPPLLPGGQSIAEVPELSLADVPDAPLELPDIPFEPVVELPEPLMVLSAPVVELPEPLVVLSEPVVELPEPLVVLSEPLAPDVPVESGGQSWAELPLVPDEPEPTDEPLLPELMAPPGVVVPVALVPPELL